MKNLFNLVVVFLLLPPLGVFANDNEHEHEEASDWKISSVPTGEVINGDYFAYGESVEISGTVNGDVYAVGAQVIVDGTINGDLLAAAGKIIISGDILYDARIAGGRVTVGGNIGKNLTLGGCQVELTKTGRIQGGLVAGGCDIHVAGDVGRDVALGARSVTISNNIGGDANIAARGIRLTSQADVGGDFTYWSKHAPSIDDQANVSGSIIKQEFPKTDLPSAKEMFAVWAGMKLFATLASFTSTLALGLLLIHFYPKFSQRAVSQLKERPLASIGLGFLVLIVTPVLVGLLGITLLGIPLAVFLMGVFLIYIYLGRIFVIAWAGKAMFEKLGKGGHEKWAFTSGLVLYSLLAFIPFLGGIITFLVILFGLGAIFLAKKEVYVEARNYGLI
jgi:hypothetical protein